MVTIAGTAISGGRFYEEYLTNLRFPTEAVAIYDKMRRSDYQIKRTLSVINAHILGANFSYKPLDPNDALQIKQATFKNNLFNKWANHSWQNMLYEILSYLVFGFAVVEPYYKIISDSTFGDIVVLADIGLLKQSTIYEWDLSNSTLNRVKQIAVTPEGRYIDKWISGDELLVFTNEREGLNFEGVSILRSCYGPYIRKDLYLKLDMIGLEKMSIGNPVFYLPKAILNDTAELAKIKNIASMYVAHEASYLILDDRLKDGGFEIIEGKYNSSAVNDSIKREDAAIIDSILASFLTIGTQRAGGNAQNEGHQALFLQSLLSVANYIAYKLDYLANYLYTLNFGYKADEPILTMSCKGIMQDDAKKAMEIIRGYATSNLIIPDDRLEVSLRKDLDLPEKDKDTERLPEISSFDKKDYYEEETEVSKKQRKPQNKSNPSKEG